MQQNYSDYQPSGQPELDSSSSGAFLSPLGFPSHCVVGVIHSQQDAQQAIEELSAMGYGDEDIYFVASQRILAAAEQKTSRFQKILSYLRYFSDDGFAVDSYIEAAKQGHHILAVQTTGDERIELVRAVLAKVGAHGLRYFSGWTVSHLPS